jgi:2,3-bisphosphoglycerate-independent phosphoglycerate mutase
MGATDAGVNPLVGAGWLLSQFADGTGEGLPSTGRVYPVDPTFGVTGRPQSATNQAALLTGEPAPRLVGRHVLGFPTPPLRALIERASIVKRLVAAGGAAVFANAYPAGYLDAVALPRRASLAADVSIPPRYARKLKASAIPLALAAGGVAMRTLDDARRGDGITHDITGARARARGLEVPLRSFVEAAEIFWRVAEGAQLAVFEHYLADEAGHAQDRSLAVGRWEASMRSRAR